RAVAKTVPCKSAATRHGDLVGLYVDAHFDEMALHGNPRALRRDPRRLVVVSVRAAAREGVAEPEVARQCDLGGDVGKGRGTLVGGNDEIGIIAVVNDDSLRMHDAV